MVGARNALQPGWCSHRSRNSGGSNAPDAGTTCRAPRETYGGTYSPEPCDIGAPWIRLLFSSGESKSARCDTVIAIRLRCDSIAPLERPVVPLV